MGAYIVAIGKRMGFSFTELNEMRVQDLIDVANAYHVQDDGPKKRWATQEEIDGFTG